MREVRRSSSAFLAPRIARRRSLSPSPERRKESRMDDKLAGGWGCLISTGTCLWEIVDLRVPHPTICRHLVHQRQRQAQQEGLQNHLVEIGEEKEEPGRLIVLETGYG